jgi:hypothetical protein
VDGSTLSDACSSNTFSWPSNLSGYMENRFLKEAIFYVSGTHDIVATIFCNCRIMPNNWYFLRIVSKKE